MRSGPTLIYVDVDGTISDIKKDSDIEFLDLPANYEGVNKLMMHTIQEHILLIGLREDVDLEK